MKLFPRKIELLFLSILSSNLIAASNRDEDPMDTGKNASAQGAYVAPSTPELYDVNEPLVPAYARIKKVKSHPYMGLAAGLGMTRNVGSDGSPKPAWSLIAEGGYVRALSSWSRADLGVEVFNGSIGDSDNTINLQLGALAKLGYGYNISENLHGIIRAGYGITTGQYSGPLSSSHSASGYVWQLGIQVLAPTESVDLLAGIFFNQYGFAKHGTYNVIDGRIGMRVRL